ncbi:hypothetical protein [Singulisphaera sp. PoT]|uniref:hypothetical protein n=1 Tax=Singulisphaera sp. PoT TaxID=3411797 RepID=UPI003BF54D5B
MGSFRVGMRGIGLGVSFATVAILVAGCGQSPQVSGHNREIIVSLATAVSSRNDGWLDANAKLIEERHSQGKLADGEYEALKQIVAKAKAGDWPAAEKEVYALRDGQQPTAEDLENLAGRKLGDHGAPRTLKKAARGLKR